MPRIVPHASPAEWELVYSSLYGRGPLPRGRAVDIVKAWALRSKVPHAVLSTAAFVEIVELADKIRATRHDSSQTTNLVSPLMLRMMLGLAFVRFVNGIVDAEQRAVHASSVSKIASTVGLPSKFVDLRHAATHDELPALNDLLAAATDALAWLEENYWLVQKNWDNAIGADIDALLEKYYQMKLLESKGEFAPQSATAALEDAFVLLSEDLYQTTLIPVLVSLMLKLPENVKLPKVMNTAAEMKFLELPRQLQDIWDDCFGYLMNQWSESLSVLIICLFDGISSETSNQETALRMLYARHILQFMETIPIQIVEVIFMNPTNYTTLFIDELLSRENEIEGECNLSVLIELYEAVSGRATKKLDKNTESPSISDIQQLVKKLESTTPDNRELDSMKEDESNMTNVVSSSIPPWMPATNGRWKSTPIGCLCSGNLPDFDFLLPSN